MSSMLARQAKRALVSRMGARSQVVRSFSTTGRFKLPPLRNEPLLGYAPGSKEREALKIELKRVRSEVVEIPCVVGGKHVFTGDIVEQVMPSDHGHVVARVHQATEETVQDAIKAAAKAKDSWANMPFEERAAIFYRCADLVSTKYRARINAANMLGIGKTVLQAEIDSAAELIDFMRMNPTFAEEVYAMQPSLNDNYVWNRSEYRPLEGFVLSVAPFNFLAIGANLPCSAALMGNTVLHKPATAAVLGNWIFHEILHEAGMPEGVINFLPGAGSTVGSAINSPDFAGLHFTGSTGTFNKLWSQIGNSLETYKSYPRVVGETGGKNYHFVHASADVPNVVNHTVRGAFEYQGQKCSATSRMYVPESLWPSIKEQLVAKVAEIKVGQPDDMETFMSAVIDGNSFNNIRRYIDGAAASPECEIITGGTYDDSKGYFVQPTIIVTTNPRYVTMEEEIFGPVLTLYVYADDALDATLELCDTTSPYGLTGSIFANDRLAIKQMSEKLRDASGCIYYNQKSSGAVIGQQPFGGARKSGTNDKAGSVLNLLRWVSPRTIKEEFTLLDNFDYPHMAKEE